MHETVLEMARGERLEMVFRVESVAGSAMDECKKWLQFCLLSSPAAEAERGALLATAWWTQLRKRMRRSERAFEMIS